MTFKSPGSAGTFKSFQWDRDVNLWAEGLQQNVIRILEQFLSDLVDELAPEIEQWMKDNGPWTDRTGRTRASLYTEVEKLIGEVYTIFVSHGDDIEHAEYLELYYQGRFAIIQPALDTWFPIIWKRISAFVGS